MGIYLGIPTINNLRYLKETLESIQSQHHINILIIDNLSNDGITREWVESSEYEKILNPENLGVARAWNQILNWGLSFNDCELIFILNNDIVLHHEAMDNLIQSVFENGKEGITGVQIDYNPIALQHFVKSENRYIPNMHFSCFGLTPKTIKRIGLFDEGFKLGYFEDNDYHHRMMRENVDGSCDTWAAFTHYGSRAIREGGVNQGNTFSENREYFRSKWGFVP